MTYGVYNNGALSANAVTALGEGGTMNSFGLYNDTGTAVLVGGSFTGRGYDSPVGIRNGGTLNAAQVTALGVALDTGAWSIGLSQEAGVATLAGGSYTGRGGDAAYGIYNAATLSGDDIVALGEAATVDNFGLGSGGVATLRGGTFTGRGGTTAAETYGIWSSGTLAADNVVALGDEGTGANGGLVNNGGTATVQDGTFTGRGGDTAFGISSSGTAVIDDVTAHGRGATNNYGLFNGGTATLRGGSYTGSGGGGGGGAYGLYNLTALTASSITATGENNANSWGLWDMGMSATITQATLTGTIPVQMTLGPVDVSNSRLIGNAVAGPVTCTAVSRGLNFVGIGPGPCP